MAPGVKVCRCPCCRAWDWTGEAQFELSTGRPDGKLLLLVDGNVARVGGDGESDVGSGRNRGLRELEFRRADAGDDCICRDPRSGDQLSWEESPRRCRYIGDHRGTEGQVAASRGGATGCDATAEAANEGALRRELVDSESAGVRCVDIAPFSFADGEAAETAVELSGADTFAISGDMTVCGRDGRGTERGDEQKASDPTENPPSGKEQPRRRLGRIADRHLVECGHFAAFLTENVCESHTVLEVGVRMVEWIWAPGADGGCVEVASVSTITPEQPACQLSNSSGSVNLGTGWIPPALRAVSTTPGRPRRFESRPSGS